MSIQAIKNTVKALASDIRANQLKRFFKTGVGEYAQGDIFAGLTNSQSRQIAKQNSDIELKQVQKLLESKIHQQRFIALVILTNKFKVKEDRQQIYQLYLRNTQYVNNWDLVDLSAPHIVGQYLKTVANRSILYNLTKSQNLWERRIAIVSTHAFIRVLQYDDTIRIAEMLLGDKHDLIHKGVGWMLREIGKREEGILQGFIKKHYDRIPRTTLRYSIQKFPEGKRKQYLQKEFQ